MVSAKRKIGILALQGAVEPHVAKLTILGVDPIRVRRSEHLAGLEGIIIPGGESTTFIHLLTINELWEPLSRFVREQPTWGVCAGAILLAQHVLHPEQKSLGAIDITVSRNAFGHQSESFTSDLTPTEAWPGEKRPLLGVFIRAPRFEKLGASVKPLFLWQSEPVMVEHGLTLASTFHPELTEDLRIHEYFLQKCEAANGRKNP